MTHEYSNPQVVLEHLKPASLAYLPVSEAYIYKGSYTTQVRTQDAWCVAMSRHPPCLPCGPWSEPGQDEKERLNMDDCMMCPLLGSECLKVDCEWYATDFNGTCAMCSIAQSLKEISLVLNETEEDG